jgi:hypothetical protein
MNKSIENSAIALISQYGEEAETIAMLRAAEYAASMDTENWLHWEQIIKTIKNINLNPSLDG